jgi:hypothetical protein
MWLQSIYIAAICYSIAVSAGAGTYSGAYITGPQTIQNATYIPVIIHLSIFTPSYHHLVTEIISRLPRLGFIPFVTMSLVSGSNLFPMEIRFSPPMDKTLQLSMELCGQ